MSVMTVTARAAIRQALITRPSTLSSVSCRCLTLPGPTMAKTDLRDIGREPKLQPRPEKMAVDQHPSLSSQSASAGDQPSQQEKKSDGKLWRWIPNVEEESHAHAKQTKPGQGQQETLHQNDPNRADNQQKKRNIHPDDAPDAQGINDRRAESPENAEKRSDFEKIRSKIDYANYPAPKRLSSLKEAVHADLEAARGKFDEVKENLKHIPEKAKDLEHKIEEKGAHLAERIKSFVKRDKTSK